MTSFRKMIGSASLIAGTCIGAGMLALPISMASLGFHFSIILMIATWLLMCFAGLLVIEVNTWLPENTSYISMAKHTLGKKGQWCTWLILVLMLYSLLAAYITAGGALLESATAFFTQPSPKPWIMHLIWTIVFAISIYLGMRVCETINRFFMIGLIAAFACLASAVAPHIKTHFLPHYSMHYALSTLPIIFVSFGYHVVLPSIRTYLHGEKKAIRWAVITGSFFPILFYGTWMFLVFASIPNHTLSQLAHARAPVNALMLAIITLTHSIWLHTVIRFFVFFAIASSFIGVSLGLFDLLADGLAFQKNRQNRILLTFLTYIPPLLFAWIYPNGFILALSYAGVFVAISHGILPVMMTWSGRYHLKLSPRRKRFTGERLLLIGIWCIFASIIVIQLGINLHWIATP